MVRQIIKIDQDQCIGCALCISACHEGAIGLVDGKATLLRDDYCDGLGNCLPMCPSGAISFEQRQAAPFVQQTEDGPLAFSCPSVQVKVQEPKPMVQAPGGEADFSGQPSQLSHWPVQLKLVAPNAAFLKECDLLIAADCTAFAHGDFHQRFMKGRVTLIGCPKLDEGDYAEKLAHLIVRHNIKSVTVARMDVPCCGALDHAVKRAIAASGKIVPLVVVTLSTEGEILSQNLQEQPISKARA